MEGLGVDDEQRGLVLRARSVVVTLLFMLSAPALRATADAQFGVGCDSTATQVDGMPATTGLSCTGRGIASATETPLKRAPSTSQWPTLTTPSPCSAETRSTDMSRTFDNPAVEQSHNSSVHEEVCRPGQVPTSSTNSTNTTSSSAAAKTLADQTRTNMTLPLPKMAMTPATDATQFVSLPIWLQLAPSSWVSRSAAVSAGIATLTMLAEPTTAVWSMGDGSSVTCHGPGTPYPAVKPKDPMAPSPDCGYTYAAPSISRPQGAYPVSVTVHWKVTWSTTTGLSGSEPDLTAVASTRVRVAEIQALVTEVGP